MSEIYILHQMQAIQDKAYELLLRFDQDVRFPLRIRINRFKRKANLALEQLHISHIDLFFMFVIVPVILTFAYLLDYAYRHT